MKALQNFSIPGLKAELSIDYVIGEKTVFDADHKIGTFLKLYREEWSSTK